MRLYGLKHIDADKSLNVNKMLDIYVQYTITCFANPKTQQS